MSRRTLPASGRRALEHARLALASRLVEAGIPFAEAAEKADGWLLGLLAMGLLNLDGNGPALQEACCGQFRSLQLQLQRLTKATGLPLDMLRPPGPDATASPSPPHGLDPASDSAIDALAFLAEGPDPFGELGQWLRASEVHPEGLLGTPALRASERRRNEGGYYTAWKLARRLAGLTLVEQDENVPSLIDPACGAGTFLAAAFDILVERLDRQAKADPLRGVEPVTWTVAALHGVEQNPTALLAARLSLAVRAVLADRRLGGRAQLSLFGQAPSFGPLIHDRLRLGDSLGPPPADRTPGTDRLRLRLTARDAPGRLPVAAGPMHVAWDADFPLRFTDVEGAFRADHGFDVVLANPPFVPVDRIPPDQRAVLRKHLQTYQRRYDLAIGFVERAFQLLASGGTATLLLPRSFLTENNAEEARALLLKRAQVVRLEELGPVKFDKATVPCVALTVVNRRPTELSVVEIWRQGQRQPVEVRQSVFTRLPRHMLRPEVADPAAEECLRLARISVPLGRYFCAAWGARGIPVASFHLSEPDGPLCRPMLKGDDISPFQLRPSSRWLKYDVKLLYRPSRPEFFESEKLLVRKVSGAAGIICAVDMGRHYTDDSVSCVVRKADLLTVPQRLRPRHGLSIAPSQIEPSRAYDMYLIAALLQTPLVQRYYRLQLGGGLNVFPDQVESLPLPALERLGGLECARLSLMARRAAQGESFDEEEADRLARRLYGLDEPPDAEDKADADEVAATGL